MTDRILVTGAQGFIGRYLIADLLHHDDDVNVLGIGRSPASPNTFTHVVRWGNERVQAPLPRTLAASVQDDRYTYHAVDICNGPSLTSVVREFQPTVVVHLAGALRDDPFDRLIHHNILGVAQLLDSVIDATAKAPLIVLGSSGSVYGVVDVLPIREDALCVPVELYATIIVPAGQPRTVNTAGPLCGPPRNVEQCKEDSWLNFNFPTSFENQGDCVSSVATAK